MTDKYDYYKILGVLQTATHDEIKRVYQTKLKKMHPDKIEQTKDNILKYKLVRQAGDLLTNPNERIAYNMDRQQDTEHSENFKKQKDNFKSFMTLQTNSMTQENKKLAELEFEKEYIKTKKDKVIDTDDFQRKIETLELERETQMNEISYKNIFNNKSFDSKKFNKYFEKTSKNDEITKYNPDNIFAYNDENIGTNNNFSLIDDDNDSSSQEEIDLDSISDNDETQEDINKILEQLKTERETQNNEFDSFMENGKYKSSLDDKYGVSNSLGFMVGTDIRGNQNNNYNIETDYEEIYKELTQ
jgi:curved DNA-binding protein CbpA